MRKVLLFLFLVALGLTGWVYADLKGILPDWLIAHKLLVRCALAGGVGGFVYCARSIYLNVSVKKRWGQEWEIWYFIRPIMSVICGSASFVFLKSGILVLGADKGPDSVNLGFYALAFVAGMNVDGFLQKIEDVALATWGIGKSRTANRNKKG